MSTAGEPSPQSTVHVVPLRTPVGNNPSGAAWNIPWAAEVYTFAKVPEKCEELDFGQGELSLVNTE